MLDWSRTIKKIINPVQTNSAEFGGGASGAMVALSHRIAFHSPIAPLAVTCTPTLHQRRILCLHNPNQTISLVHIICAKPTPKQPSIPRILSDFSPHDDLAICRGKKPVQRRLRRPGWSFLLVVLCGISSSFRPGEFGSMLRQVSREGEHSCMLSLLRLLSPSPLFRAMRYESRFSAVSFAYGVPMMFVSAQLDSDVMRSLSFLNVLSRRIIYHTHFSLPLPSCRFRSSQASVQILTCNKDQPRSTTRPPPCSFQEPLRLLPAPAFLGRDTRS